MTRPKKYLVRMVLFLIAVAGAAVLLLDQLQGAFFANGALNGLILGVLFIGILNAFRQVAMLNPEVKWIEDFRSDKTTRTSGGTPRLLASMAAMFGEREGRNFTLSAISTRSLLDGIATRLEEQRDLSRYNIGLLIFLGLLGTFWGLLSTVDSVGDVIAAITIGANGDLASVFNDLKRGLEAPIEGMGTAFSSSLFGLAGSLVLGFLDLQMGQAQNRFYTDLEDWLSTQTRLSSGSLSDSVGDQQTVPAYVEALLEQTADSLEKLQRTIAKSEDKKIAAEEQFMELTAKLGTLSDTMRTEQALMAKLAEGQIKQTAVLEKFANSNFGSSGLDEASQTHLRNIDIYTKKMVEYLNEGRSEMVSEIRQEIRLLARTIAAKDS